MCFWQDDIGGKQTGLGMLIAGDSWGSSLRRASKGGETVGETHYAGDWPRLWCPGSIIGRRAILGSSGG